MQCASRMYVYRLRSIPCPNQIYSGITDNPKQRLADHNAGKSPHTNKYKPWKMELCIWFAEESKARAFEKYLKSGSGRAFSAKHF
ncbi:MAG: GIY-YIG nuclease family protein [Bdellovibrionales bacterium]|nr:GIY-YIG nuclease family protein [Bdellovibrionales bacterium]